MNTTPPELRYRRVMLKLSGEALAGDKGFGIVTEAVDRLTEEIGSVASMGVSLGVVIGGGNIVRGALASRAGMDRVQADYMGMLATVINALALQDLLEQKGIETRVMTAIRMEEIAEPYIRRRALRHMVKGRVVLFAGGIGNPYFSTDTGAVLRAIEMGSEVVIKATKVRGVYTADPVTDSNAEFIPAITFQEVVARELAVMDTPAVALCKQNSLPIIVLNLEQEGAVARAILGEPVGTLVS
ncbi:MAG TPA: UMP kinase [Gemmatimonadetes bacterium]|jgi:uridylate kinase|nr:UMP kinase [Gemmatimonadota bacterium]HIA98649.1 UMP kinase [Gemmatimonadota bacterium]HIN78539.1 UMP kinase [Gemmatimonadota bacterium]